jgi:hypothetical protein
MLARRWGGDLTFRQVDGDRPIDTADPLHQRHGDASRLLAQLGKGKAPITIDHRHLVGPGKRRSLFEIGKHITLHRMLQRDRM